MISERELLILRHLREDSRKSLAKIARQEAIPVSTLFNIVHQLESKAIRKNTTLIDFSKIGYNLTFFAFLKASEDSRKALADFLIKNPNTN